MVMEASPSPQSVGREFVRQYYTLLNKAPTHLHRFYNNYSSFVHGGLDAPNRETPPVVGQKQIHNRIQQLNFRDCHAKISQVDSQATLGNGVVVQVTGELSNGGAPMRRFTQTFVLAAQSPKKYYVHNDIFRYQDLVFSEEEGEGEGEGAPSEGEEEAGGYFPALAPPPASSAAAVATAAPFPPAPPAPSLHARSFDHVLSQLNGHSPDDTRSQLVAALQGTSLAAELEVEREAERESDEADDDEDAPAALVAPSAPCTAPTPPATDEGGERMASPQPVLPPAAPEPKTYANLLKSGGGPAPAPPPPPPAEPRAGRVARPARADNPPPLPAETPAPGARRYSDSQQLFLGNLPHNASEEELRALFGRFGAIAELRVHAKPGGRNANYGFITYEELQSAHNCLNAGPLYFPADNPDGCKLNVEEKKARSRPGGSASEAVGGGAGTRGGRAARPLPSHRPPFPSRVAPTYRR